MALSRPLVRAAVSLVVPATVAVCAFALGPQVDAKHPAGDLGAFFSSAASVLAAVLIALALLSVMPPVVGIKVHIVVSWTTPTWLAIGVVAALTGLVPRLNHTTYRVCFGATVGASLWLLIVVLRIAKINLSAQYTAAVAERAALLTGKPPTTPGGGPNPP